MTYTGEHRKRPPRRAAWLVGLLLALPLVVLAIGVQPATAANVVNYTFHAPASVQTNPCYPMDIVNLNGDIHIVITTTADSNGGYRVDNHLNSQLSGASITTGTSSRWRKYVR